MEWYWWILMFYLIGCVVVLCWGIVSYRQDSHLDTTVNDILCLCMVSLSSVFCGFYSVRAFVPYIMSKLFYQDFLDKVLIKAKMEEK